MFHVVRITQFVRGIIFLLNVNWNYELENIRYVFSPPMHHYIVIIVFINSFIVIRQGAPSLHNRTSETLNHWPHTPILTFSNLESFFYHGMMPWKFCDDIRDSSGVIVLTNRQINKQTKSQTDTAESNSTLAMCDNTQSTINVLFKLFEVL